MQNNSQNISISSEYLEQTTLLPTYTLPKETLGVEFDIIKTNKPYKRTITGVITSDTSNKST